MHTTLWILFFVYAAFSLIWAVLQISRIKKLADIFPSLHTNSYRHWSYRLQFHIREREFNPLRPLYLLGICILIYVIFAFVVVVLAIAFPFVQIRKAYLRCIVKPKQQRRAEEQRKKNEAEARAINDKIAAWKKNNPPVIYYNTINGVTAVMLKVDYDIALREYNRAVLDGRVRRSKFISPNSETFLYCHASATNVPDEYRTGWLSDFCDLKSVANVQRRDNIFVPFVS